MKITSHELPLEKLPKGSIFLKKCWDSYTQICVVVSPTKNHTLYSCFGWYDTETSEIKLYSHTPLSLDEPSKGYDASGIYHLPILDRYHHPIIHIGDDILLSVAEFKKLILSHKDKIKEWADLFKKEYKDFYEKESQALQERVAKMEPPRPVVYYSEYSNAKRRGRDDW